MKLTKPLFISSVMALALAGCGTTGSVLNLSEATPITIENAVKKQSKIEENDLQRWSHLDLVQDSIPGMSVDRAYAELIKEVKGKKVIVGIIDSGIDIEHPDLAPVIWTNPKESKGNGKDDDKNGYVDDLNGWNFLGDAIHESYEFIRLLKIPTDGSADYQRAENEYEEKMAEAKSFKQRIDFFQEMIGTVQKELKKEEFTIEELQAIDSEDEKVVSAKEMMERVMATETLEDFKKRMVSWTNY